MNYIRLINTFWKMNSMRRFSANQLAVYFAIVNEANQQEWPEEFVLPQCFAELYIGISRKSFCECRDVLAERGLITFEKGNSHTPAVYRLIEYKKRGIPNLKIKGKGRVKYPKQKKQAEEQPEMQVTLPPSSTPAAVATPVPERLAPKRESFATTASAGVGKRAENHVATTARNATFAASANACNDRKDSTLRNQLGNVVGNIVGNVDIYRNARDKQNININTTLEREKAHEAFFAILMDEQFVDLREKYISDLGVDEKTFVELAQKTIHEWVLAGQDVPPTYTRWALYLMSVLEKKAYNHKQYITNQKHIERHGHSNTRQSVAGRADYRNEDRFARRRGANGAVAKPEDFLVAV